MKQNKSKLSNVEVILEELTVAKARRPFITTTTTMTDCVTYKVVVNTR